MLLLLVFLQQYFLLEHYDSEEILQFLKNHWHFLEKLQFWHSSVVPPEEISQ